MAYSDTENAAEDWKRYEDIIRLPHHVSATHPQMPVADRAAQFSPFAALTGYRDAIRETGSWMRMPGKCWISGSEISGRG